MIPNLTIPGLRVTTLAIAAAATLLGSPAFAGTITVDDDGDTVDPSTCTLRAAMQSAFQGFDAGGCTGSTASANTIEFADSFTIIVGSVLPNIVNDVTVDGSGQAIVIDGNGADTPFVVASSGHLTLSNLAIQDFSGLGSGGAVRVNSSTGALTAVNVTFSDNSASQGGAISSNGRLVLTNVNFLGNSASTGTQEGGAIHFAGAAASMTITDAAFTNNSAGARGGAIAVTSLGNPSSPSPDPTDPDERFVMMTNTVFSLNSAGGDGLQEGGGAIFATTDDEAFFSVVNGEFLGNSADGGGGGAILLTLGSRVAFVDPSTPSLGGIVASHFFENSAGGTGDNGIGGAILSRGHLTVVSSSFIDNSSDASSGGAIGHNGSSSNGVLTVANVTFSGNEANQDGGAIAQIQSSGEADVIHGTFSGNSAANSGGAIFNANDFEIANSILANNSADNCGGGAITDQGGNIQFNPDAGCATIPVGDPMLASPTINPGPNLLILTMALQGGSAALGAGDPSICAGGPVLNLDARGMPRPAPSGDPSCDSGAYESDLAAQPPVASLTFIPASHGFGPVYVGSSDVVDVILENTGTAAAANVSVAVPAAPFSQSNTCPATLQPAEQCTVTVEFAPAAVGSFSDNVVASADGGLQASVALSGEGVAQPVAVLTFTPASHAFGPVQVGDTAVFDVILENTGNAAAANVAIAAAAAPFSQNNTCPATLQPAEQCTVSVAFAPTAVGSFSDDVVVSADGGVTATLSVSGEGVAQPAASLVFTSASHAFGAVQVGDTDVLDVTLENIGNAAAANVAIAAAAAPFSQNNTCPATLQPAEQCTVSVAFAPTAVGSFSDDVVVSADGGVTATLSLSGEGVAQPVAVLTFTPASHAFGPVQVGDTAVFDVILENTGAAAAANLSLEDPVAPFSQSNTCPATLQPAQQCTVTVEFAPAAVGSFSDNVVASADGGIQASVGLSGNGAADDVYRRYFAEGAVGPFFDTRFALFNPGVASAEATLHFADGAGQTVTHALSVPALSQVEIDPESVVPATWAALATIIEADRPLVTSRTVTWGAPAPWGSHTSAGVAAPQTTWWLSESATGVFSLFYLVYNPHDEPAQIDATYFRPEGEAPVTRTYTVAPRARTTIFVNAPDGTTPDPDLGNTVPSAHLVSTNAVSVVVERAMYLTTHPSQPFTAGTVAPAVSAPLTQWTFAEGATGFFELFLCLSNPHDEVATATVRYLRPTGGPVEQTVGLAPQSRRTIWVNLEAADLLPAGTTVAVEVDADHPILAERAMWWGTGTPWWGGHAGPGVAAPALRWALAGLTVGGPTDAESYLLLVNPHASAAEANVTLYFEDGTTPAKVTVPLGARNRTTVRVLSVVPAAAGRRFGVVVESSEATQPLVVEGAAYATVDGQPLSTGDLIPAVPLP